MTLNLTIPQTQHQDFTPRITVIGVGGGGTNAVNNMIAAELKGVEFVVANTDAQQLQNSRAEKRIQLGPHITGGLGAGAKPEVGRAAAEEALDELYRQLDGSNMVFITAGMGGGTGTGAAPVIARVARERNILTVGVVTKPFGFEGKRRMTAAEEGIAELQQHVDTLIVIPNQNLFRMANERTTWKDAFQMADQVLYMGVRGVTDLMTVHGLVNLDFADIKTVMAEMGSAMMGTGEAEGENRAIRAAEAAINNPLLEDTSMAGAKGLLINITGGDDLTLFEVDQAANRIREEVDDEANVIFGSAVDPNLNGRVRVSVVATGIHTARGEQRRPTLSVVGGAAGAMPEPRPIVPQAASEAAAPLMETVAVGNTLRQVAVQPVADAAPQARARQAEAAPETAPAVQPAPQPQAQQGAAIGLRQASAPAQPELRAQRGDLFPEAAPPAAASQPRPAAEAPKPSLFGAVTGVFKRRQTASAPAAAPAEAPRVSPAPAQTPVARAEPAVQTPAAQAAPQGGGSWDIPAFLRR